MIDTREEKLIPLTAAARIVPGRTGNGCHVATVWRWAERGVGGKRLETVKVGGQRYTSEEALSRFIAECSGTDPKSVPSKASERSIERKQRECEALGV